MLKFAASPTGDMPIQNLRVAILNYLVAQQRNEPFLIRIDDGNKASNIEGNDTEIMQILEKFALKHESVFHQSEHLHMHQTFAIKLLEEEKAFVCTCTKEEIEAEQAIAKANNLPYLYSGRCENKDKAEHAKLKESATPFVLRIKKPKESVVIHDTLQGNITTTPNEVDAFIILNKDGTPSHDFASACDDMLSGVNFTITTNTHTIHTSREEYIKKQLGFTQKSIYSHIPRIIYREDEENTVKWLFTQGFIPDAIINYLLLLGYNNVSNEIFTLPQAIEWFDLKNISTSDIKFDIEKLKFINREHLRLIDNTQLSTLFGFADAEIGQLAKLYLEEVSTTKELEAKISAIFNPKNFECPEGNKMQILKTIIQDAPMLRDFEDFKSYILKKSGLKEADFIQPLRILLTGTKQGPELSDIYPLIKSYLLEIAS